MAELKTEAGGSSDVAELPRHRRVLQESGPATGRIMGINHLVLFTHDMNAGVRFYRDVLGMRVVRTMRFTTTGKGLQTAAQHSSGLAVTESDPSPIAVRLSVRQVFFEMGSGELFSLYEAPGVTERPPAPISSVLWPSGVKARWSRPVEPQKLDHLSFDVGSHADVVWFREHLLSKGIEVSDVSERRGANNTHRFISSIYFADPSGNPLEISSFDAADPGWQTYDFSDWLMDEDPVPALLDESAEPVRTLVPHWVRLAAK
ncbi:glyoxalase [Burkholderia savannae]|uniref:VOC family protein n=1 Tax=Burkholderia savannae TaxID=1637837 RepID=UPI00075A3F6B|nr:VOC family protein [Burkholderia savannae]AOJ84829.1 glyoxalase [Burkholderia savannae]